jgi:hypothetical protein
MLPPFARYLLEVMTGIPVSLAAPSVHFLYHKAQARPRPGSGDQPIGEGADINVVLKLQEKRRTDSCDHQ